MKYIPGYKFTINGTMGGTRNTIFNNNGPKAFIKSPIEGLELNTPYEISFIRPIKEDGVITSVIYSFVQVIKGRGKKSIDVVFSSIREAENAIDSVVVSPKGSVVDKEPVSSNLQQRLRERTPLASNQIRSHRKR